MINDSLKETEYFFECARDSQKLLKEIEVLKKRIEELERNKHIQPLEHNQYNIAFGTQEEIAEYNEMVTKFGMPTCSCHGLTFEKFIENKKTNENN